MLEHKSKLRDYEGIRSWFLPTSNCWRSIYIEAFQLDTSCFGWIKEYGRCFLMQTSWIKYGSLQSRPAVVYSPHLISELIPNASLADCLNYVNTRLKKGDETEKKIKKKSYMQSIQKCPLNVHTRGYVYFQSCCFPVFPKGFLLIIPDFIHFLPHLPKWYENPNTFPSVSPAPVLVKISQYPSGSVWGFKS